MPVHKNCVAFLRGGKTINGRKPIGRELREEIIVLNRPATGEVVAQTKGKLGKTAIALGKYSGASITFSPGWIRFEGPLESVQVADAIFHDLKAGRLRYRKGLNMLPMHRDTAPLEDHEEFSGVDIVVRQNSDDLQDAASGTPRCGVTALREMVDPEYHMAPLVYVQGEGFYEDSSWYRTVRKLKKGRDADEAARVAGGDDEWRILSSR